MCVVSGCPVYNGTYLCRVRTFWKNSFFTWGFEQRYLNKSMVHYTMAVFQLVNRIESLQSLRDMPLRKQGQQPCNDQEVAFLTLLMPFVLAQIARLALLVNIVCTCPCREVYFFGALRIAWNGLCTAARCHTAEENPGCRLGYVEEEDCLRHCNSCPILFDHFGSLWLGTIECISRAAIFNGLPFNNAVRSERL